jgi:hypothetical protein
MGFNGMTTLIGRTLNATKNADGTVSLEFFKGVSCDRSVMTLSSAEVTALAAVLSGVTGTKSSASHSSERANHGECD